MFIVAKISIVGCDSLVNYNCAGVPVRGFILINDRRYIGLLYKLRNFKSSCHCRTLNKHKFSLELQL